MRSLFLTGLLATSALAQWPSLLEPLPAQGGGEKDAALIISLEDYVFLPRIPGAKENATAWLQHLVKTRGVPGTQVKWLQNSEAALESMRKELKATVARVKPGGVLWVVFIGHGAPSEDGSDGLLVGADAQNVMESFSARSLKRSELLGLLEAGQQKASVVLLDACFSGQSSSGELLVKGSMPTLPERETQVVAKKPVLVLSAGTSRQVAGALPGKDVPAFSYLALGGLRGWADENHDGTLTAGEVVSFSRNVMGTTLTGRTQTPTLNPESAVNAAVGKVKAGETLPLVDILVWLKGSTGSKTAAQEPAVATGPKVSSSNVKPVVGSLTVKTTPHGARLDLVDPKGQALTSRSPLVKSDAAPGRWRVTASADGYVSQAREVEVAADDVAFIELSLQKPASLEVVGSPEGALVKVLGPGFSNEGGLPWKAEGLTPGAYEVSVSREAYGTETWTGSLTAGQAQRVTLTLKRAERKGGEPRSEGAVVIEPFKSSNEEADSSAKAAFAEVEEQLKSRRTGRAASVADFKPWLSSRQQQLGAFEKSLNRVISIGSPYWAIAARTQLGLLYGEMARDVANLPDPLGLDDDQQGLFRSELENRYIFPFEERAVEQLEGAIDLANSSLQYSVWVVTAQNDLNRYKPGRFAPVVVAPPLEASVAWPTGEVLARLRAAESLRSDKPHRAVGEFLQTLSKEPNCVRCLYGLASLHLAYRNWASAERLLSSMQVSTGPSFELLVLRAKALAAMANSENKRGQEAGSLFEKALEVRDDREAICGAGWAYSTASKEYWPRAMSFLTRCREGSSSQERQSIEIRLRKLEGKN